MSRKTRHKIILIILSLGLFSSACLVFAQGGKLEEKVKAAEKKVKKKEKTFRVDFRDKDIQDFLKAMSKVIGKNIITDDKVKGKITVISPKKIPVSQAYSYLTSVLAVKGYGVVEEGALLKVITLKDAIAKGQEISIGRKAPYTDKELAGLEKDRLVTHIITLEATKPSRIAGILKRVTNTTTDIVDYDEEDTLIITGGAYEVNRLVKIILRVDKAVEEETDKCEEFPNLPECKEESITGIQIYWVKNLEAEKIEATLRRIPIPAKPKQQPKTTTNKKNNKNKRQQQQRRQPVSSAGKSQIDVFAHKESNTLIYIGTKEEFKPIKKLIQQIDIARDQVLLEVLIVEITADDENSFGIDWRFNDGAHIQNNTGLIANSGAIDSNGDITGVNTLVGFSLGFISDSSANLLALLNANVNKQNFSILSAPQILTIDNQEAEINVGQDVPILGNQRTSGAGDQTVAIQNFEYRPTGVKLKFTPQINNEKKINLNIFAEVKDIASVSGDATQNPTFTKRDLKTTIEVKDKQTIVIGGLVSKSKTKSVRKIPVLGDLPILGYLFKRVASDINKTNLMIFITPHVLTSKSVADQVTEEILKQQQLELRKRQKEVR